MLLQLKENYKKIPVSVRLFAKRALLLITGWVLLYHLVLQPQRVPDRWLTNVTAGATAQVLSVLYSPATYTEGIRNAVIFMNDKKVLLIGDNCNAFQLYILYIGFLLCIPTSAKRTVLFILGGIAGIFILNVLRCYALTWLNLNNPGWVNFAHKYAFTFIVYLCIFYGWVWYSKKYEAKETV